MVVFSFGFTTLAAVIISMSVLVWVYPDIVVWGTSLLCGIGIASSFPSTMLWAAGYIRVGGSASAVFLVGNTTAVMLIFPIMGAVFQNLSPHWFVHFVASAAILNLIIFSAMQTFASLGKPREKTEKEDKLLELDQTV